MEQIKSKNKCLSSQQYDAVKIWNEMKSFGEGIPFTVFFTVLEEEENVNNKIGHMTVIPDKELQSMLNNPLLSPYVNDVMDFFIRIENLKNNQPSKPIRKDIGGSNNLEKLSSPGLALFRSGCVLQPFGQIPVYSPEDTSLSSVLIGTHVKTFMSCWKDFFKQVKRFYYLLSCLIRPK